MQRGWISPEFIIKSGKINNTLISGYASVFGVTDSQNDMIAKGAFRSAEKDRVKLLWQHDVTKPIGIITILEEDEYGLKIEAEINNRLTAGAEATELIKQKAVCGLSVGFTINSSNFDKQGVRVITDAKLMEVSVVTFPANDKATIIHMNRQTKSAVGLKEQTSALRSKKISVQLAELESLINKLEEY